MADLLPRFYDVNEGGIYIDGINIKDFRVHDLRGLMGNVNQEAILFNDSFYNNITFGVENATMEQVIEAAKSPMRTISSWRPNKDTILALATGEAVFREGSDNV